MTQANKEPQDGENWSVTGPFRPEGLVGWVAGLPTELHALTDGNEEPYRSKLRLFEDGRALGPPHAGHEAIRRGGRGAYSFWAQSLYFSTSDGSDPNRNNRTYTVALLKPEAEKARMGVANADSPLGWRPAEQPLRCAIVGLGNRGMRLGLLARSFAGIEIVWAVDRSEQRVAEALALFGAGAQGGTDSHAALHDPKVDIVIVAVPDYLHRAIAEQAFRTGKHVFLEKPLATTATDAQAILSAWQRSGRVMQLGYVLRQAPFYAAIRSVLRDKVLGPVRIASLTEQLDVRHGASFMRRWHAQSGQSGGLIVHKACHDLDIICWLLDARPRAVSSFGGLDTFAGPPPAPFCSLCTRRGTCPHVDTGLHERRTPAEMADPTFFGLDRCVFRDDKDIVDNQVVSFVLDCGVRGNFYLAVQGPARSERRITLIGDDGRLDGTFEDGRFTISFTDTVREPLVWTARGSSRGGHGGGDRVTMLDFLNACAGRALPPVIDPEEAIRGLIFALAAEQARREDRVVRLGQEDFDMLR